LDVSDSWNAETHTLELFGVKSKIPVRLFVCFVCLFFQFVRLLVCSFVRLLFLLKKQIKF
jgi:hypothetical protein